MRGISDAMAKQIDVHTQLPKEETGSIVVYHFVRDGELYSGIDRLTVWPHHPLKGTAWVNLESEWRGDDRVREQKVTPLCQSEVDRLRKIRKGLFFLA